MSNIVLKTASTCVLRRKLESHVSQDPDAWHLDYKPYGSWDNAQIQHVLPGSVARAFENLFADIRTHSGGTYTFDVNSIDNLLVLPNSADAQAFAARNGQYAAVHLRSDKQHITYTAQLNFKMANIRKQFHTELNSSDYTPEQAAHRAANRIATLQAETAKLLYGTNQDAVKLYTSNHDRFLIDEYNRHVAANPDTGPPINTKNGDPVAPLTLAEKKALADFQTYNYARIDFNKNLPESIELRSKLGSTVEHLRNGSVDGPVLLLTVALTYDIIKTNQINKGFDTFLEAAEDLGITVDAQFFTHLVAGEIIDSTISATLGPIGWAKKIWEVYQSAQGIVAVLELAHARWPDNFSISAVVDIIETLSTYFSGPEGLDQILFEVQDGDAGGIIITGELAEKLRTALGSDSNKLFELADGTAFFTSEGLASGQSVSLLGPRGFDVISALRNKAIVLGVSELGEKFSITGQEFIDSYQRFVGIDQVTQRDVFEAVTGVKLLDDFTPAGTARILAQLERAATFHPETNPAILIDDIYANTLLHFGHGHEVFALSDGQIYRVPGGLNPGDYVNLLKGERTGNPHIDPTVGFGIDAEGKPFEVDREGINYVVEVVSHLGGEIDDEAAVEALSKRAADLQEHLEVSLREALDDGESGSDTLEGGIGDDTLQGPKISGPKIIDRNAVFTDIDGDGVLDSVTRVTDFSNATQVRKTFTVDQNGVPITEGRVTLYRYDQAIDGAAIGSVFGSQLGTAFAGDDLFAQIGAGSVLSAVLGNLGEAIDLYYTDNGIDTLFFREQRLGTGQELSIEASLNAAFEDFGANLLSSLRSAGVNAVSGFLAGELGEALGIDGGFEGQLFQTVASNTIGTVAETVANNALNLSTNPNIHLFSNLNPSSLLQATPGAVSSFVGGYLAREIISADSQAGAIGGSIGGAIGSTIGFGLAGVGFFGGLGSSAIGSLVGGALSSTVLGVSLGAIILPGVGAFLGTILGTLLGDLFDDLFGGGGYAKGTANVSLDFESGLYYESGTNQSNGGDTQLALVTSLAERSETLLNSYLELLGGENANSHSPTIHFFNVASGAFAEGLGFNVRAPGSASKLADAVFSTRLKPNEISGEAVDRALEDTVLATIKATQTKGGDLYLKRAVLGSQASDLRTFTGDLKIAEDYKAYLKDKAVIDALIAAQPDSAFAAGWLITLLRAEELGLTTWQESDFYGGLEGLLMSLDVERTYGVEFDDVLVSIVTETLTDGTVRRDLLLQAGEGDTAEIIARINGFEAALGFTVVHGNAAEGTPGKDIWFAGPNGGRFNDQAIWSDEDSHDILIGRAGVDIIKGGMGWDFIRGGGGSDVLYGGAHEDTVYGQDGHDILLGDDETYSGGKQGDFGTHPDSLKGADANDGSTREWFGFNPQQKGPLGHYNIVPERTPFGADKLFGGPGNDNLIGAGGSDRLYGGIGNDRLFGGADSKLIDLDTRMFDGDDYLEGGLGADRLEGGEGFDTASYAGSTRGVEVDLNRAGSQTGWGHARGDILVSIEDLIGSAHDDRLTGDGGANIIEGGAGDDLIDGAEGVDTVSYFSARFGVEVNLSPDPVRPAHGFARLWDTNAEAEALLVEEDELRSIESVIGTAFDDVIRGSKLASGTLSGGAGDDHFQIAYDDTAVSGGAAATHVLGGEGFDTLSFAHHVLSAGRTGVAIDLTDTAGGNIFSGIEYTIGSAGDDVFTTGFRADYLKGGKGNDRLSGGPGKDKYLFDFGDGKDTISDVGYNGHRLISGGDEDTVSFGAGIEFRHITGALSASQPSALPRKAPEAHFATADLQLGIRDITGTAQDYETSISAFANVLTIEFGGSFDSWKRGAYSVQEGAGVIERLQFADSGHLDVAPVQAFLTGSRMTDTLSAASEAGGSWLFAGAGHDVLRGAAGNDILVGGLGADRLSGGRGDDQYAYWRGDGHDILSDTGGLDTLVFGGGIGLDDLHLRRGRLLDRADPDSFAEAASGQVGTDLRIEVIDPENAAVVVGTVTIADYRDSQKMIERIRVSARDEAIDVLKQLDPVHFSDIEHAVQLQYSSSIDISLNHLLEDAIGSENADILIAPEGQTLLRGYGGDDALYGGAADDVLEGGYGADVLDGGLGLDFASYENAAAGVVVDLSLGQQHERDGGTYEEEGDVLSNIEGILGSQHQDVIQGNLHGNILNGGPGNDQLFGDGQHIQSDVLRGRDTFVFVGSHGFDTVHDFEVGRDTLQFNSIEPSSLSLRVSNADTIISHAHGAVQGKNVQWKTLPADGAIVVNGSALSGYGNVIIQQGGAVTGFFLSPLPGAADQAYSFTLGKAALHGAVTISKNGDGAYSYAYTPGSPNFSGNDNFSLKITGADGSVREAWIDVDVQPLSTSAKNKKLSGSLGHDHLMGGERNDQIFGDTTGKVVTRDLKGGNDVIRGEGDSDQLYGDGYDLRAATIGGDDELQGGDGVDILYGDGFRLRDSSSGGDDVMHGGAGNDKLYGDGLEIFHESKAGNDRLNGGVGDDHLFGDGKSLHASIVRGSDTFLFVGAHGNDIVYDFESGRDVLEFHHINASSLSLSLKGAHTLIRHDQGSVQVNNVQWTSLPANGAVEVNGSALVGYGNIIIQQGSEPVIHQLSNLPGSPEQAYTFALAKAGQHGTVTISSSEDRAPSYSYALSSSGFSGKDSFSLEIIGADGRLEEAFIGIEVQPESEQKKAKVLIGTLGHDYLVGGQRGDQIFGDTIGKTVTYDLRGGNDVARGAGANDQIYGDGYDLRGVSTGGDDILDGGEAGNRLYGDGVHLRDSSQGGNDSLQGGNGNDVLYGDAVNLYQASSGGNDTLFGGAGNDTLFGDGQKVMHQAKSGDDILNGGAGNDHLYGDGKTIHASITRGHDTFVFEGAHGSDVVFDFETARDVLKFDNIDASTLSLSFKGAHSIISHDQGSVQINNVQWSSLDDVPLIF